MWVIDIDEVPDKPKDLQLRDFINRMPSRYEKNLVFVMPTKSGVHFITHPFSLQQFNLEYSSVFNEKIPDVKKNHLTLLFEDLNTED